MGALSFSLTEKLSFGSRPRGSAPAVTDADALALIARFSTPPTPWRAYYIERLIVAAKAHGWWNYVDQLCLIGADSQCSLLNWKNNGIPGGTLGDATAAPAFTADRYFTFDGINDEIDTGFNPTTVGGLYAQDSAFAAWWSAVSAVQTGAVFGWTDGTDGVTFLPRHSSNETRIRINQGAAFVAATGVSDGAGFYVADRSGPTALKVFRNGVQLGSDGTTASAALNNATFKIGLAAAGGYTATPWLAHAFGGHMPDAMHAHMYADILAYLQAIGAV